MISFTILSALQMRKIDSGHSEAISKQGQFSVVLARANRSLSEIGAGVASVMIADTPERNTTAADGLDKARAAFVDRIDDAIRIDPAQTPEWISVKQQASALLGPPASIRPAASPSPARKHAPVVEMPRTSTSRRSGMTEHP